MLSTPKRKTRLHHESEIPAWSRKASGGASHTELKKKDLATHRRACQRKGTACIQESKTGFEA